MESVIEFEFVCLVKFSGNLFIADTNNNIIRYLDLNKEEPELQTLELKGVQPPTPKSRSILSGICLLRYVTQLWSQKTGV